MRRLRNFFACLVALVLPLQASVMAYAQAAVPLAVASEVADGHRHAGAGVHDHDHDRQHDLAGSAPPADPCHDAAAFIKCCHSHAVWSEGPAPVVPLFKRALIRDAFVARWTSFIPEEPSPPPIAGLAAA